MTEDIFSLCPEKTLSFEGVFLRQGSLVKPHAAQEMSKLAKDTGLIFKALKN